MGLNRIILKHKKIKIIVCGVLYMALFLFGIVMYTSSIMDFLSYREILEESLLKHSIGFSFLTVSTGFFFFMVFDYLEYAKTYKKVIFNVIGIILMVTLTVCHACFDSIVGILNFSTLLMGVPGKYIMSFSLSCFGYIYMLVVRRVNKLTNKYVLNQVLKILIQLLLPVACLLITIASMYIGIAWIVIVWIIYIMIDMSNNRMKTSNFKKDSFNGDLRYCVETISDLKSKTKE